MAIITISRGTFSGGKDLAQCLAQRLGYRSIDRESIIANASSCGASEEKLREAIDRPPSFLDHFSEERRRYITLFQACLSEEARRDGLIYLGNAGHLMLHGVSHVLRVRIIAPLEQRAHVVQESLHLSHEEALAYVEKRDHDRAKWTRFLYGVDWSDPVLYDLVINLERTTIEEACHVVSGLAAEESFRVTPESQTAIENLALSSRVRGALLNHPESSALVLEVEAKEGVVTLRGKVRNHRQWQAVEEIVKGTPGVERLVTDDLVQVLDS
jgi:cytidylate kinase